LEPSLPRVESLYRHLIIRCLDQDEQSIFLEFINKFKLDEFINSIIKQIEDIIHDVTINNSIKADEIKTIAYTSLKKINERLKQIESQNEKEKLKKLISKLAKAIILEIEQQSPSHAAPVKMAISQGLEQAIKLEGYDKKDFEAHLKIDYNDISKVQISVVASSSITEYLLWDNQKANLKALIHLLLNDYDCIKSKAEFGSLFEQTQNKKNVRWSSKKTDFLILLINSLYKEGYIKIKNGKGIWKVIMSSFVDFDKNPFTFNPTKRLNILNNKESLKSPLAKDIREILDSIKVDRK
jgi:hypothetical protein